MTRTTWRRRAVRPLALTAGVLAVLGAAVGPAAASATTTAGRSETAETAPVMIVLDASGSMNQDDAPGPRIDAAKTAVRDLVTDLPDDARVGLTVYGTNTGSSDAEKAAGCADITQLAPVGPVDKPGLTSAVDGIRASGYTPIGASLQKAAAALPNEGPRSVVLVSDGEDTCSPPPPCDVAAQLKQQGVDLVVHTVGFKVDDAARAQLTCIAQATGGTYSDAQDAGGLEASIDQQVSRALEPYDVTGQPVTGTSGPGGAPVLEPGQYKDTLANGGDDYGRSGPGKYFAVDLQRGQTPYLSATVIPPASPGESGALGNSLLLTAKLTAGSADSSDCEIREDAQTTSVQAKVLTTSIVVAPGAVGGPDWPEGCPTEGRFFFFVSRNYGGAGELPMEVAYRSEPPVEDTSGLPGPASAAAVPALPTPSTQVTELAGGASYNSAPEIQPGQTYSDTVVFGEDRYFKIHLDWGQQLAFRFDTQAVDGRSLLDGVQSRVYGANPVRQELHDVLTQTDAGFSFLGGQAGQMAGGSSVPVRWTNRQSKDTDVTPYAVDGDYYVVLTAGYSYSDANERVTVPYTVTVDVTGTKEDGPRYMEDKGSSSSGPDANGAQSNGGSNGAQGTTTMPPSEASSWTTQRTTVVGGAVGLGVLAAIVLGWLVLGRRRSPRPPQPPVMPPNGGGRWWTG